MPSQKKNQNQNQHHHRRHSSTLSTDSDDLISADSLLMSLVHKEPDGPDAPFVREVPHPGPADPRRHQLSTGQKISNLKELNDALIHQVSTSRSARDELDGKVQALQAEIEQNSRRTDALLMEKKTLEDLNHNFELEVSASQKQVLALGLEKEALVAEKDALLASKHDVENALATSEAVCREVTEKLDEARKTLASTEGHVSTLTVELEGLRSAEQKLVGELEALQAQNAVANGALKEMRAKKQFLEGQLGSLQGDCAEVERQVAEANGAIVFLKAELSKRDSEREGLQMQLEEAWEHISKLQAQQVAQFAKDNDLETKISNLEAKLLHIQNEHSMSSAALEQERNAKGSLQGSLDAADSRTRNLELHLENVSSSVLKLQSSASRDQKHISSLESQVSSMGKERAMLEEAKAVLENEIKALNIVTERTSSEAKGEIEKLEAMKKELEVVLAGAKEEASQRANIVCKLEADLKQLNRSFERKSKVTKVTVPLSFISTGSLAIIGISALVRQLKRD